MIRTLLLLTALAMTAACAHVPTDKERSMAKSQYDIAVENFRQARNRDALRALLSAVELNPEEAKIRNLLGIVYHTLGRLKKGAEHYQVAVKLDPGFSEAHNNYGTLLIDLGRYDQAIDHFRVALNDILYPTPSFTEGNMGWAYYLKGESDQAKALLRNAVSRSPSFCRGYEWLVRIGLDTKSYKEVDRYYRNFQKFCIGNDQTRETLPLTWIDEMHYLKGRSLLERGDVDAARVILAQCELQELPDGQLSLCEQTRSAL